jgi:hypothetical protein
MPTMRTSRDQQPTGRRVAQQVSGQLRRGLVGPVQVVEDQHDGASCAEPLQKAAYLVKQPVLVRALATTGRERCAVGHGERRRARPWTAIACPYERHSIED